MDGLRMRSIRQQMDLPAKEFAALLNERLGRSYDGPRVSRWEGGNERIPANVLKALSEIEAGLNAASRTCVVVAIANQKGGVGKTTSTVNIAYALSELGARVLVIDADGQGNLTNNFNATDQAFGLEASNRTMFHVLAKRATLSDIIIPTEYENIKLAPATISLAKADIEIAADPLGGIYRLDEQMKAIRGAFDVVLIDCAPSLGGTTSAALVTADLVLVPVQTESFALLGVAQLIDTIETIQYRPNPKLQVLGLLPTMFDRRTNQHRTMLSDLRARYASAYRIFDPIPRADLYGTSTAACTPALAADPKIRGSETYREVAAVIFARTRSATDATTTQAKEAVHGIVP